MGGKQWTDEDLPVFPSFEEHLDQLSRPRFTPFPLGLGGDDQVTTQGTVVAFADNERADHRRSQSCQPVVEFAVDGLSYQARASWSSQGTCRTMGKPMDGRFPRGDPASAVVVANNQIAVFWLVALGLVTIATFFSMLTVITRGVELIAGWAMWRRGERAALEVNAGPYPDSAAQICAAWFDNDANTPFLVLPTEGSRADAVELIGGRDRARYFDPRFQPQPGGVPPGWYPDDANHCWRWWNGRAWTAYTAPMPPGHMYPGQNRGDPAN